MAGTKVDNPRIKELSDEAARRRREAKEWRQRAEAAEARLAELEGDHDDDDETADDDQGGAGSSKGSEGQGEAGEGAPEGNGDPPDHSLRIENAFLRHAHAAGIGEVDDAWKLIDQTMVQVSDDGTVEGMDKAVLALTTKYPSFKGGTQRGSTAPTKPSGKPASAKQKQRPGYDVASLQGRFPALRRGR